MGEVHDLFPSFNAGELSPRLAARVDFSKFKSGLAECTNFIPLAEGGITRRSGSRYIAETKDSTVKSRLKRFEFSTTQAYVLEFGNQYIRFYRNQGQITSENITASIANGTFDSNISSWSDISSGGGSISHNSTNNSMNLNYVATEGHAEQQVTNSLAVEHIIKFRVRGAPGDSAILQVGTTTGASDLKLFTAQVGWHSIAFTATAANFFIQFKGNSQKVIQIDDVSLIDNSAIELDTPYAEADLTTLEGPQSADVLYLFHSSYPTYKLERRGHTTWSLVEVAWQDGPWLDENITSTTITPATATGKSVVFTASSTTGINDGLGFQSTDVGRLIRYTDSTVNWGWGIIVSIISTTAVRVDIKRTMSTTTAETKWRLGDWSGTTGYPSVGTFFEQRMFTANTTDEPQSFWASQTADFENHSPDSDPTSGTFDGTVEDDDAFDFTISADDVNAIFWMSAGEDTLTIGTAGGEWVPSSTGAVLTPSDIAVKRQVTTKAAQIQPVRVDNVILFVQRAKRKIKEFGFAFEVDGFQSIDMTRLAQHITRPAITEMAFAEEPESQVWSVRSDGKLLSMTFRRKEDVVGWGTHVFGGRFANGNAVTASDIAFVASSNTITSVGLGFGKFAVGDTLFISGSTSNNFGNIGLVTVKTVSDNHGTITVNEDVIVDESAGSSVTITAMSHTVCESVITIPGNNGAGQVQDSTNRDEVWVINKRTINGTTKRYVEMLERDFEDDGSGNGDSQEDCYYSDSLITYDGVATTGITGLSHLEGETVKILADGATHADKTVSGGAITLDRSSKVVQIGLGYNHRLKFLRLEGGNPVGTAVGKIKRIDGINFVLLNCQTLRWGPTLSDMIEVDFREVEDAMDEASVFFTGDFFAEFEGDWGSDPRIWIENDDPTPFTLLSVAPELRINPIK